jgi:hypothetical protein
MGLPGDDERIVRPELAKFLATKRAALPLELVGLRNAKLRRAIGLWPEEVALLAQMSLSVSNAGARVRTPYNFLTADSDTRARDFADGRELKANYSSSGPMGG